ncbi:MAG: hypothetical protein RL518_2567 [Pseudomonadota bacterium]|jgi:hypothetical protein
MDRAAPAAVTTVMFCLSTSSIKTRVHFFPTAASTASHQPITCVLSLFGKGIEKRAVMLDGGRLNQPDGVRLEEAFPTLRNEASGIFGLQIQLSSQQGRVNLLSSQAAIELVSPQSSLLYYSAPFVPDVAEVVAPEMEGDGAQRLAATRRRSFVGVGMQDAFLTTSLVMVNSTNETIRPSVFHGTGEEAQSLPVGNIAPESAMEIPLEESLFKKTTPHECLWGLSRAEKIAIGPDSLTPHTAFYVMYRDPVSKRPVSVCAL